MAPDSPAFTEEQWLASADPAAMLTVIYTKSTKRQLRLFMAACCRRVWRWLSSASRQCIEVMEQAADNLRHSRKIRVGLPSIASVVAIRRPEASLVSEWYSALSTHALCHARIGHGLVASATVLTASAVAVEGLQWGNDPVWEQTLRAAWMNQGRTFDYWDQDRLMAAFQVGPAELGQFPGWATERQAQADLLRHIVGNPFRPYATPDFWPATVVELAQAVYDGSSDHRILSDALEDAGHRELAEHFRREDWHPKGCWALDLILAKGPPR